MIVHVLEHTIIDNLKLLPILFLTYLVMEYIEHRTEEKTRETIAKAGRFGPVPGALLGMLPQCGFSAAASNLYAGRIITLGTLFAIFLSTSDEMLPILLSEQVPVLTVAKILGTKALIGILAGFVIDLVIRKKKPAEDAHLRIEHMCDHEHCNCNEGNIFVSAFKHTLQIFFFILIISLVINLGIEWIGEDVLASFMTGQPILGPIFAGVIGLIPNCASSVVITQLYLEGVIHAGAMMAGLLAGSGVGLLILFRANDDLKENLKITFLLYAIGVAAGILMEVLTITF
ncbi:MAG: arsenic efflux protein [Lachnospiraceae bacterium]|nr:arsenic efflux protein [Lachnospiraceae bacterium]